MFQMTELEEVLNINMSLHEIIQRSLDNIKQSETDCIFRLRKSTDNGHYEVWMLIIDNES
jgi:hypothetical protein